MKLWLRKTALAEQLRAGAAAIIPTDTVPGLAALPTHADQIWTLKRRPADKPLILMSASSASLLDAVSPDCHRDAAALAARHWPGALTLVLPAVGPLVRQLNPGNDSLGVRVPNCRLTCELLRLTGPLATSSANPAGQTPAGSSTEAARLFPNVAQLGPLPWPPQSGLASTVVRWRGSGSWQLLRQGAVMLEESL